ncbi:GNAT family N-acetyltransferase [Actinoplanes sp. CA-030573]|uniref:GNAT family N-acetyltransferase n=1 Tax=Actinoplanes sp. CA-030573 TaxID=3239898 RepID=UPI003D8FBD2E
MERETITAGDLVLRPFVVNDIPWVHDVSLDPAVQRFLQIPLPYRRSDAEFFVREMAIAAWDRRQRAEFVVTSAGDGTRLGRVGLGLDGSGAAQIGYWMDPAARGRGVATVSVRALCRWAFDRLALGLVEWRAEVGNVASRRVAEKAGFRLEATLRQRLVHRGVRVDAWVGSMLPSELTSPPARPTRPASGD